MSTGQGNDFNGLCNMIITTNDPEEILRLQKQLATEFEMKILGGLKYFMGIEVARSE